MVIEDGPGLPTPLLSKGASREVATQCSGAWDGTGDLEPVRWVRAREDYYKGLLEAVG